MKVFVVDDSRAMRMIVKRTLRQAGFENIDILEAENGKEALAQIRAEKPALILSDWNMPEMDGYALLTALRAEGNATPFGFVTAQGTPEMQQRARAAGASFFVTKPITVDALQKNVARFLR